MGVLKDAFFLEVWRHLLRCPKEGVHLSTITNPSTTHGGAASSWKALQADGKKEGMNKGTGPKAVLLERPDIFQFEVLDNGHPNVSVQEGARTLSPEDGLPAKGSVPVVEASLEDHPAVVKAVEDALAKGETLTDEEIQKIGSAKRTLPPTAPVSKNKKSKPTVKTVTYHRRVGAASPWTPVRGAGGFRDVMWTPELQEKVDLEIRKETQMVWALFEAIQNRGSIDVQVSMLGSDFKVKQLKEDSQFNKMKLLDLLKQYDQVFDVKETEGNVAIALVSISPTAEAALPEPDEELAAAISANAEADMMLPPRIDNPSGVLEKMQALRIEIMHALSRRDNKASCGELGQDPRCQKAREGISQAKSLQNFVKLFPVNFGLSTEDAVIQVSVVDYDVTDQSMLLSSISAANAAWQSGQSQWHNKTPGASRPWDPSHKPAVVPARFVPGTLVPARG